MTDARGLRFMEDEMARPTKKAIARAEQTKDAQDLVRRVLESVFGQKPSKRTIATVAEKVVRALPGKGA